VYASILSKRMKREIEEKGVVPDSQAGFKDSKREEVLDGEKMFECMKERGKEKNKQMAGTED
jgi:hypothetical protein